MLFYVKHTMRHYPSQLPIFCSALLDLLPNVVAQTKCFLIFIKCKEMQKIVYLFLVCQVIVLFSQLLYLILKIIQRRRVRLLNYNCLSRALEIDRCKVVFDYYLRGNMVIRNVPLSNRVNKFVFSLRKGRKKNAFLNTALNLTLDF